MWCTPLQMVFKSHLAYKELTKLLSLVIACLPFSPLHIYRTPNDHNYLWLQKHKEMLVTNRTKYLAPECLA